MATQQQPFGVYPDVTGVVDATAAAEIVALIATLQSFLPEPGPGTEASVPHTDFDKIPPAQVHNLNVEIDAAEAAIAAAPTA